MLEPSKDQVEQFTIDLICNHLIQQNIKFEREAHFVTLVEPLVNFKYNKNHVYVSVKWIDDSFEVTPFQMTDGVDTCVVLSEFKARVSKASDVKLGIYLIEKKIKERGGGGYTASRDEQ